MRAVTGVAKRLPVPPPEIKFSTNYLERLHRLVQSKAVLKQNGYVLDELSAKDIERKKRCYRYIQKGNSRNQKEKCDATAKEISPLSAPHLLQNSTVSSERQKQKSREKSEPPGESEGDKKQETREPFWSCCNQYRYSKGCQQAENHCPRDYDEGELEAFWKYYTTPKTFRNSVPRFAVALDCEMGTNKYGETELIRISVIDYFSSEVLIDSLVFPDVPMSDYNTRYSGVSIRQMEDAYRKRLCFFGKDAAREAIWKFVGPKTIIVGHSANNDLTALRWIHERVIDTMLIDYLKFMEEQKQAEIDKERKHAKNAEVFLLDVKNLNDEGSNKSSKVIPKNVEPKESKQKSRSSGKFSLKSLTKERIGRNIQQGRSGHDSLEDAIAARDLAHWNVMNQDTNNLILI
ncbi:hypothetical protein EPUL_002582 [Erysiphe pulchra]|uniref:Exonuclease domain-containing protein n=1 Tax=Erysiphe pulchra TaxID=225359 RepID=A0A2S4Q0F5_9PEZI|nr:hypothetical protein EPUL_002582 [Erysiphe pulchra]